MYKKNASSNRDALFGGAAQKPSSARSASAAAASATPTTATAAKGYTTKKSATKSAVAVLSGTARDAKIKEAEDYRAKANECMKSGFFKKPDPVAACTYFKRTADCYQQLGERRLERLYRVESGQCNVQCGAWASAASDFTRAAALVADDDGESHTDASQRRRDAAALHKRAAEAWTQMNEKGQAAASTVAAAVALHAGVESSRLSTEAVTGMEEAVEAHVPDPLNPYARYRQTGISAYIDPHSEETVEKVSSATLALCQSQLVTRAYAHEPLQQLVHLLAGYGEYASALYAEGAVSTILQSDGLSTLSLSRSYVIETILTLAMGDPVTAEEQFLQRHCQDTFYLKSRECQLAEELFRAVKNRDLDALDLARSPTGPNRAALANLPHDCLRTVVQELRVTGVARKQPPPTNSTTTNSTDKAVLEKVPLQDVLRQKTGYEIDDNDGVAEHHTPLDAEALSTELEELDFSVGTDSDDDNGGDELDAIEDDDIDLR